MVITDEATSAKLGIDGTTVAKQHPRLIFAEVGASIGEYELQSKLGIAARGHYNVNHDGQSKPSQTTNHKLNSQIPQTSCLIPRTSNLKPQT